MSGKYRAFLATAELESLTKAADYLGYTQSGVSHLLNKLEDELGFQLLIRAKSGAKLTAEGEFLLPYAKQMLLAEKELSTVAQDLRGAAGGRLRLGSFTSVTVNWLPPCCKNFRRGIPASLLK